MSSDDLLEFAGDFDVRLLAWRQSVSSREEANEGEKVTTLLLNGTLCTSGTWRKKSLR